MTGLRWVKLSEEVGRGGSGRLGGNLQGLAIFFFLMNNGWGIKSFFSSSRPISLTFARTGIRVGEDRFGDKRSARGWRAE